MAMLRVLPPRNQTYLQIPRNQIVASCENVLQKIESSYPFCATKAVYVARLPAQTKLVFQNMT